MEILVDPFEIYVTMVYIQKSCDGHRNNKGNFAISNPSSNGSDGYVSLKWTLQVVVCQAGAKNLPILVQD